MVLNSIIATAAGLSMTYLPKLFLALLTLVIGWKLIGFLNRSLDKVMEKKSLDVSLRHFLVSLIGIIFKILLVISVASMIGIATTSFVAIVGAAGLAVGLALQGSLANFAGGVLILIFKPFDVGDYVESNGHSGVVKKIEIFNTVLTTIDNKIVVLPNGIVSNNSLVNYTKEKKRRVDMTFGIGYSDDIKKAKKVMENVLKANKKVLKTPKPDIYVSELGDSSVNFVVRPWVKTEDYWDVYFATMEGMKLAFDANGLNIPFPQMDIHVKKE